MTLLRFRADGLALLAFFILVLALAEAHECAHILTARAICGGWGSRDFSVWTMHEGCAAYPLVVLATFVGPVLTFATIWLGAWLTHTTEQRERALGLALIFAPLPFARIFTAATGHGDEVSGFTVLFGNQKGAWAAGLAMVLLFSLYPLVHAYRTLEPKRRMLLFAGLLLVPMVVHGVVVHNLMNQLLASGVLASGGLLGAPVLINLWQVLVFGGAAITTRGVSGLFVADTVERVESRAATVTRGSLFRG
jgi:hypothetical protein